MVTIMKKLLLLFLSIMFFACEDPNTLPGKHDPDLIDSSIYEIIFEPNFIDVGVVHPIPQDGGSDKFGFEFKVSNNTDTIIQLDNIELNKPEYFNILDFPYGHILTPKGSDNSSLVLYGTFSASASSYYYDTLKINSISEPIMKLQATVPIIYPKDIDFDTLYLSSSNIATDKLIIKNDAPLPINIDTVIFVSPEVYFSDPPQYPIEVPANNSLIYLISCKPTNLGEFSSNIIIKYNSSVIADTEALVKAEVIE